MQHLIDTRPKVATCNRCGSVVLACMSSGMRAAVDPTPLNFEGMRDVLIAGRDVYRILYINGKPAKLELVTVSWLKIPAARRAYYAGAHGCGCKAMDATAFEEPAQDPQTAPVAPAGEPQGPAPASPRSDPVRARCKRCGGLMGSGEMFMVEWPVWDEVTHHYQSKGPRKGYDRTFMGWGTERWAIHAGPDGCPTNGKTT
jgi:hypothetical protein